MVPSHTTEPILLLLYLCEITVYLFISRNGLVISYITQLSRRTMLSVESQCTGIKRTINCSYWGTKRKVKLRIWTYSVCKIHRVSTLPTLSICTQWGVFLPSVNSWKSSLTIIYCSTCVLVCFKTYDVTIIRYWLLRVSKESVIWNCAFSSIVVKTMNVDNVLLFPPELKTLLAFSKNIWNYYILLIAMPFVFGILLVSSFTARM